MPDSTSKWLTPDELRSVARAIPALRTELRARKAAAAEHSAQALIARGLAGLVDDVIAGADGQALARRIDHLLGIPGDIERAYSDLVAGAEAQAAEFGDELEALRTKLEAPSGAAPRHDANAVPRDTIAAELERRFAEDERAREALEGIEISLAANLKRRTELEGLASIDKAAADEHRASIAILRDRIAGEEATREDILAGLSANGEKMRLLKIYQDALDTLSRGLPDGIIGEELQIIGPKG